MLEYRMHINISQVSKFENVHTEYLLDAVLQAMLIPRNSCSIQPSIFLSDLDSREVASCELLHSLRRGKNQYKL